MGPAIEKLLTQTLHTCAGAVFEPGIPGHNAP